MQLRLENTKGKHSIFGHEEIQRTLESLLKTCMRTWEILIDKLLKKTVFLYARSFKDHKNEEGNFKEGISEDFSIDFIHHNYMANIIIPLILSLLMEDPIKEEARSTWAHS